MVESPDKALALRDATGALDALACPWALIGGVAVGLRSGVPRATIDTDLAVSSRVARSVVIEALVAEERASSDPAQRRSKALRDQADVALLSGDVPDPDEGW